MTSGSKAVKNIRTNKTDEQCKRFLPGLSAAAELAMHAIAFFEKKDRYHAAESLQGYNCSESYRHTPRHGICEMFYTSEIPNFYNVKRKMRDF